MSIDTRSLGPAGWLSTGAYDTAQEKFVPPPMSAQARRAVGRMVVQLPAAWELGDISWARDEIVWYRVSGPPVPPPPSLGWSGVGDFPSTGITYVAMAGITYFKYP